MKIFSILLLSTLLLSGSSIFAATNGCKCKNCACVKESNCGCLAGGECCCVIQEPTQPQKSCCEGCSVGKSCNCEVK